MLAATFDIGTTAVKAVVVNENGEPVFTGSSVIHTIETGNFKEQDPDEWYGAFCSLSKEMLEIIPAVEIGAIIFSGRLGQKEKHSGMRSFIPTVGRTSRHG